MAWCGPLAHTVALCQIHINDHQHLGTTHFGCVEMGNLFGKMVPRYSLASLKSDHMRNKSLYFMYLI